ncbi:MULTISPECIES: hypothetical protein [Streptomyces]|uniref:Uncharacterized protein n=1 Tax=Streptomyces tsukubensis (strain DSM 42081 / NBRC 108919 / NRRL 18488 / 9993) TaxID=1114943 RepID=I2N178_STRT9|nr:hypothetical protein [Streptomyces tsukubensis]MYS64811.1 hypothetical protein [Streptomyces sp. SID5473]AZK94954.1 hypothetical protein B7R87_14560 [Streptomyces tsukubensis]EIF90775.1 hypothetical protein [Streptomyces tsukubensis NRRL18488]QKM68972.1 hypothetical protein STSU_019210 [Streptomyces tsukubensis NRRL18488]TAI40812.1 hypothetical protein EWI31_31030 [Streptomyces tsukubensis]
MICEACWNTTVATVRNTTEGRDLLCVPCADSNYPARVVLFPPLGIYRLTERRLDLGKHGKPKPQLPPDPGPHPPKPTPKSPPGTPPV